MLKDRGLKKIESEKQEALQYKHAALVAYVDAKSRTRTAYEAMQLAWLKRRDARDKLDAAKLAQGASGVEVEIDDALEADFEQARQYHKTMIAKYKVAKAEKDRLRAEFDCAQAKYRRLRDEYRDELERAKSRDKRTFKKSWF